MWFVIIFLCLGPDGAYPQNFSFCIWKGALTICSTWFKTQHTSLKTPINSEHSLDIKQWIFLNAVTHKKVVNLVNYLPYLKLIVNLIKHHKCWSLRKTSTSASLTVLKPLCESHKLWKILRELGIPDHLTSLLRNLYVGQEATVRTGHGTPDCFKIGKEYDKTVYSHLAYLTSMQSASCKILGGINHKLESRLPGETTTSVIHMISLWWQKVKRN